MADLSYDPTIQTLVDEHIRRMGERIADLRSIQGMLLIDLEEHSGISISQLSKIEHGLKNVSIRTAVRIADALGVQLHELFVPPELSQIRVKKKKRKRASPRRRAKKKNTG